MPAEYRADTVALLHDRNGRPVTGVIVEVQRKVDRDKLLAWPVYVRHIRDRTAASQLPQLAVLSVMAHPELEIAEIAIEAIAQLPEDRIRLYLDVISKALPAKLRRTLEARIQRYEYQSDFARKYYGQGLAEGEQKGREDGLRAAVITLARSKLKTLPADDLERIAAITDLRVLTELVTALGRARTASGARTALARALSR